MVAGYVEFIELIIGQIALVNKEVVISNKIHKHIAIDKIYSNKETLKIVLGHYAIDNNFQYYVQNSCKKDYFFLVLTKVASGCYEH